MIEEQKKTAVGVVAPDFTMNDPDGKPIQLSSLRGKVVMIDFWASWCAPCRQENPNVVKLYNQYHDKGFEILGVSLDRGKDEWIQAIKDDQLTWLHVSDLQFWQNAVARQYGVNSIPQTYLLDKEGKIIAKGLRSEQLAAKLGELFPQ
jgi:peroxiredoxin